MSVCRYNGIYYPMLKRLQNTLDDVSFRKYVEDHFINPEEIYNIFYSGGSNSSTVTPIVETIPYSSRTGKVETAGETTQKFYTTSSRYDKMKLSFRNRIVESSIYDMHSQTFINANDVCGESTILNAKLLNYKQELLATIKNFLGTSENDYEAIIQEFKSKMLNADLNDAYYAAYDAYVTLRNFDELLEKETPWIKVNTAYKDFFSPFRYIYVGPQVNHYTGFSNNEHAGQEESVGKLVKILLDYLPEYNRPNTSISLPGFNSVMMKVKLWAENSTNPEVITEWNKEAACDMNKIIKAYVADTRKPREYRTYETGKLLGVLNYIYSNNMDPDVQRMFTHLIHNTVLSSYYEYEASQQMDDNKMLIGNKVVHRNLTARPVNIQATELQNIANGAIEYWKANKSGLQQIVDKWNITRDQYNIYITDPETKKTTIVSVKGDNIITNGEISNIDQLIYDVALMLLPDNIQQIVDEIYTSPKKTITSLYMPVIGYILSNAITDSNKGLVGWSLSLGGKRDLARVLSTINGSDITSVIKDANGNNLPLYQMQCLAYNHKKMFNRISEQSSRDNIASIYNSNIIFQNIQNIKAPIIRSKVNVNGSIKDATALNANDVMYLAIADDFYRNLIEKQSNTDEGASLSGIIGLQAHVYSDKNRHFIMQFDLNQDWIFDGQRINFKKALTDYIITGKERHLKPILDVWYKSNQQQLNTQIQNIINDYNKVFGINLQSVEKLKAFIEKNKAIIKSEFRKNGVEFIEEIHMSNGRFNETLEYLYHSFSSEENFNKFVNKRFAQFKNNLDGVRTTLALDRGITHSVDNILFAYFIIDSFLSNEYNKMMVGEVYSHPNKNKLGEKEAEQAIRNRLGKEFNKLTPEQKNAAIAEELIDYAVASRWIAQVKRMVIYGATYHGYAQGEKYGVPEEINMAVINDFGANVYNIIGQSSENDSMDGSGYTSPYLSRMQYVSLMDAAIPSHNKTIYSDINARYGTPKLLKWAEYEITNALRRQKGDIRLENIFKKMHNISFNTFAYEQDFDDLYYFDENTGSYYQIKHISIDVDGNATRTIIPVNKSGRAAGEASQQKFDLVINTIYNLDQLFGGAYACKIHSATNNLQWSEHNQDYVNKIICENNLKDKMIGWLVNKSAIKVGASNVNSNSAWIDDSELIFTKMSSKFGGLQMNAEHDLDESDVTEASQMISALEQNGYTHDIAISIYKELGQFCAESLSEIQSAINSTDQDLLYQIFGKAVIQAFQSGTKDTLGLAQSFVTLATNSIKDNKIQYHIPFSSSSINGIFNSTVTTNIIKKAIRRHYAGVSAVLNPSHNVMVYHEIDGKRYRSDELYDIVQNKLAENNLSGLGITINDCLSKVYLDDAQDIMNPFLEVISDPLSIDFEDTIVISSFEGYEVIKIDTFEKYEYYRNNMPNDVTYLKWTIRPKNLKGANTTFNWMDDAGVQHVDSVFNSTSQKLLYYVFNNDELIKSIKNKKISIDEFINLVNNSIKKRYEKQGIISEADPTLIENLQEYLKSYTEITPTILDTVKTQLTRKQQLLLHNLSEGKSINWNGVSIQPINVQVNTAQIAIGKLYAKQLGLLPGDSIGKIREQGSDFFKNRIMGYYNNPVQNKNAYDWVLYDGTGKKLYVKLGKTDLPVLANDNYQNIEGRIYLDGKDLYSTDGKQFYTFVENDTEYDLVVVDSIDRFRELRNGHFVHVERNYESNNRAVIVREEYGSDDSDLIMINGRNIAEYDIDTLMQQLNSNQFNKLNKKIDKLAQAKYEAFEKSLTFIGTRIPCQSMQSFSAMEAVVFTDSETNEIYVPVNIMWLEGSDLDIDKQYVMGYSVSDNGYIITEPKENSPYYMKEMALKNRIVSKIHQVILNPKNQINLTQPVTVDQVKALAEKSSMGLAARYMNGWDPSSKYRMQIENMVGKNVIGNVATAIKSFFALSNLYNTKFREIYNLILSSQYNEARNMLSKYTFTRNGQLATLANVNLEMFAEFENMVFPDDQKDLQQTLLALKYNEDLVEDQSMILGALLNSATDNAKELILKKINADTNWVDIYCLGCMLGESFDSIGEFMLDPDIVNVLAKWDTSIFGNVHNFNKISFIDKQIKYATGNLAKKYNKLKFFILGTEEIRILGRMLKINQGLPTNINDFLSYIMSIEEYVQKKLGNTFSLIEFINNPEYRNNKIIEYDSVKEHFNILEVISEVPHFAAMFNTIATNRTILDRLSKRNELIGKIYDNLDVKKLSTDKKQQLNNDISKFLINTWIVDKQISVRIPAGVLNYVAEDNFVVEDFTDIEKLRNYIEQFAIPKLKQELNDNKFIQQLTFGLKDWRAFYKLPLNMIQIDNTQKTRTAYEEILTEFNKLKEVRINDIDMNLVDLFYLYNLIVNDDKFGPNSLTRLFEDFLVTDSEHTLLLWDFNDWIDNQDVNILYNKFGKHHKEYKFVDTIIEPPADIGFNSTVIEDEDLEFENISNTTTTSNTVYATNIPIKSKLISFIKQSKSIINGLHIVTDADLINETSDIRNAKGFVRNGEIYINIDRASDDTIIHEFAHIYLAYAKNTNPNEYYALLEKLHTTDYYQLIKSRKEYSNKKGSDLDEEVLATIIGDYYNSNNMNEDAINIAKEAIALLPSDFYDLINNDVLPTLDDTFIDNYKLSQKIATKKNEVFVKEDC